MNSNTNNNRRCTFRAYLLPYLHPTGYTTSAHSTMLLSATSAISSGLSVAGPTVGGGGGGALSQHGGLSSTTAVAHHKQPLHSGSVGNYVAATSQQVGATLPRRRGPALPASALQPFTRPISQQQPQHPTGHHRPHSGAVPPPPVPPIGDRIAGLTRNGLSVAPSQAPPPPLHVTPVVTSFYNRPSSQQQQQPTQVTSATNAAISLPLSHPPTYPTNKQEVGL